MPLARIQMSEKPTLKHNMFTHNTLQEKLERIQLTQGFNLSEIEVVVSKDGGKNQYEVVDLVFDAHGGGIRPARLILKIASDPKFI